MSRSHRSTAVPRGVIGLSAVEMWERFSYYGLQAILTFYLLYSLQEGGLELDPLAASGIVGGYGGAVFLSQLIGAWCGDRIISPMRMVLIGAVVITLGHAALAIVPGLPGLGAGLGLIVLGTGCLKSNVTAIVGRLYEGRPDSHRDAGFSLFYMGINFGAAVGPLVTGFAQSTWGFHQGFQLAALLMVFSLVQYLFLMRRLPASTNVIRNPLPRSARLKVSIIVVVAVGLVTGAFWSGLLRVENLAAIATILLAGAAAGYFFGILRSSQVEPEERTRMWGFLPIFIGGAVYFALIYQIFTTASILVAERVDLSLGNWTFPAAWVVISGTLASVIIAPFLGRLWVRMGDRQPTVATKFALGIAQISIGFGLLALVSGLYGDEAIALLPVLACMIVVGSSEILVGPVGLSVASRVGPRAFSAQVVGLNFLTLGLGAALSGLLGQLYTVMADETFLLANCGYGVLAALALFAFRKQIERLLTTGAG